MLELASKLLGTTPSAEVTLGLLQVAVGALQVLFAILDVALGITILALELRKGCAGQPQGPRLVLQSEGAQVAPPSRGTTWTGYGTLLM